MNHQKIDQVKIDLRFVLVRFFEWVFLRSFERIHDESKMFFVDDISLRRYRNFDREQYDVDDEMVSEMNNDDFDWNLHLLNYSRMMKVQDDDFDDEFYSAKKMFVSMMLKVHPIEIEAMYFSVLS